MATNNIATELQNLQTNITNAYTKISEKGGTIPSKKNTDNLASTINTIPSASGNRESIFGEINALSFPITNTQ